MTYPPKKRLPDSLQKAAADRAAEVYKRCINDEAPCTITGRAKPGTTPRYLHLQDVLSPH